MKREVWHNDRMTKKKSKKKKIKTTEWAVGQPLSPSKKS